MSNPRQLTVHEVAAQFGVSDATVVKWAHAYPDFPVVKLSRHTWRIPEDLLRDWLAQRIGQDPAPVAPTTRVRAGVGYTVDDL